ncbi:MAG: protein kinase [Lentisphaeria bacterium]|nr:protein kinase [Lentisphaeria bacterium]
MTTDSTRNISPATSIDSSLQHKKRVRYILPKGCVIGGSYKIEKPLGHGGMGEVYLARHMKLDICRAIKILLPKIAVKNPVFATRFMREAKLAIQLQHPNIINVMDAEYDERLSIYYIVMEFVDGGTVRNLIKKHGTMNELDVLKIVHSVGEALAVGEERKIVHRDIKPDNIMLTKDMVVKLADLGIAKSTADSNDVDVTAPEILIGTPAYVSPEQARDAQHVDSRADIYSLGVTMYEMLTGEKPYKGISTIDILQQLFENPVPEVWKKNTVVSKRVSNLVYRMMSKEREKRPRNWKSFCDEVSALIREIEGDTGEETAVTSADEVKAVVNKPGGIVLDREPPRFQFKLKRENIKKICKYGVFALIVSVFSILLVKGYFSRESFHRAELKLKMLYAGAEFERKYQEGKYTEVPEWSDLIDEAMKTAWLDGNKPVPVIPDPIQLAKLNKCKIVLNLSVVPEVEKWLTGKEIALKIKGESASGGSVKKEEKVLYSKEMEVSIDPGRYTISVEVPGCEEKRLIGERDYESGSLQVDIKDLVFRKAHIRVSSNVPGAELLKDGNVVTQSGKEDGKYEIEVEPFREYKFMMRAEGYRSEDFSVKALSPGEEYFHDIKLSEKKKYKPVPVPEAERLYKEGKYTAAYDRYKEAVKTGNVDAKYRVWYISQHHRLDVNPPEEDRKNARKYLVEAAEAGHPEANYSLGKQYDDNGEYAAALECFKIGLEQNDSRCLLKVARYHMEGRGGAEKNNDKALNYCLMVPKKDVKYYAEACYLSGQCYELKGENSYGNERTVYFNSAERKYNEAEKFGYREAKEALNSLKMKMNR